MPTFPAELMVPMIGIIIGLLIFAGLLQVGVVIVRALRLPNDLPEGPHFEPTPPPSCVALDPVQARRIAAAQAVLRQRYASAHAAARAAQLCAELAAQDYAAVDGAPDPREAKRTLIRVAATAKAAAEQVEQAVRGGGTDAEAVAVAEAAATEATALAARFPSGRERRLRLMMVVLVIVVIWSILMYAVVPRPQ